LRGLRWWRRARGLTQAELAKASGVARSQLARIERGEVDEPRPDTLRRLAAALGVEVLDLFFGEASIGVFGPPDARGVAPHRNFPTSSPESQRTSREPVEDRSETGASEARRPPASTRP